jgi:hypothetical protein
MIVKEGQIIASHICLVCDNLTTKHTTKKHGGYNIYEDDKIIASKDTYVPNTRLSVKTPQGNVTVFSANYVGDVYTCHYGEWVEYLKTLAKKAEAVRNEKSKEAEERKKAEHDKHFSPASDYLNSVFA